MTHLTLAFMICTITLPHASSTSTSQANEAGGAAKSSGVPCDCEETKPANSRCYKPSEEWLKMFPKLARSALKGCKCPKSDAIHVARDYKLLQDQGEGANCHMYCPCLCSDFCENSKFFSGRIFCGGATDGIYCPNDDKASASRTSTELFSTSSLHGKPEGTEILKYTGASTLKEGPRTASSSAGAEQSEWSLRAAGSFAKTSVSVPTTTQISQSSVGIAITSNRKADNIESTEQLSSSSTPLLLSTSSFSSSTHLTEKPFSEDRTTTSPTFTSSRLGEGTESAAESGELYSTSSGTATFPLRSEAMNSGEATSSSPTSHPFVPPTVENSESIPANPILTTEERGEESDMTPQTPPASPSAVDMTNYPESSWTKTQPITRKVLSTSSNAVATCESTMPIDLPETEATAHASKGEPSHQPSPPSTTASSRAQPTYVNMDTSRITTMTRDTSVRGLMTKQRPTELLHSDELKSSNAPDAEVSSKFSSRHSTVAFSKGQTRSVHFETALTTTVSRYGSTEEITDKKEPTELSSSVELKPSYDLKTTSSGTVFNEPEETEMSTFAAKHQSDISEDVPTRLIPVSQEADYLSRLSTGSLPFDSFGHYTSVEEKPITWPKLEPSLFNTTVASKALGKVMATTSLPDVNDHSPKRQETSTAEQKHAIAISTETTEQTEPITSLSTTDSVTDLDNSFVCDLPCAPEYLEGPAFCYRFTHRSVHTYRAVGGCPFSYKHSMKNRTE